MNWQPIETAPKDGTRGEAKRMSSLENFENVQPNLAKQATGKEEPRLATWGDVFWEWVIRGYPREEAAFKADEWEKRREREQYGIAKKLNRKARRAIKAKAGQ